jgi:arabinogalactan endo-1,4-beta-galactosidase
MPPFAVPAAEVVPPAAEVPPVAAAPPAVEPPSLGAFPVPAPPPPTDAEPPVADAPLVEPAEPPVALRPPEAVVPPVAELPPPEPPLLVPPGAWSPLEVPLPAQAESQPSTARRVIERNIEKAWDRLQSCCRVVGPTAHKNSTARWRLAQLLEPQASPFATDTVPGNLDPERTHASPYVHQSPASKTRATIYRADRMKQQRRIEMTGTHDAPRAREGAWASSRFLAACTLALAFVDCSGDGVKPASGGNEGHATGASAGRPAATGGSGASSGVTNGGTNAGGAGGASAGSTNRASGGTTSLAGTSNGGAAGNGALEAGTGGAGGNSDAGKGTGATSGTSNGGRGAGGRSDGAGGMGGRAALAGSGGSAAGQGGGTTATLPFSYYIGADVTDQETQPDATRTNLLTLMKDHGFNYVRLRTFVDPKATDGYDKQNGYDDITHTVAFGKQIKDSGMGLLVDFHYSDNWADPGKQCVPVAWQSYTAIADLATAVHDYTKDAITKLVAGGARPDMVQIGNEITPGMLIHRCDSGGQPTGENPITGKISNWTNLGSLLKAGVQGVKDVDASIVIALHIDQGDGLSTSKSFITNAQNQGVKFDAFGESCYTAYQGQPSGWKTTFDGLASAFPTLRLFIAEYGPEERAANDIIFGLANDQGIGTFNWEPTTQGDWNTGHDLLRRSGSTYTAQPDLMLYDQMKTDYASRL